MSPYREPAGGYDPPTTGFDHWPEREREISLALYRALLTDRVLSRWDFWYRPRYCERDVLAHIRDNRPLPQYSPW